MKQSKAFLYIGLVTLLFALISRWTGLPASCFWVLFSIAILSKSLFLFFSFREKGFKPQRWLYFILTGVALILLSMPFKTIVPIPWVYKILFYCAITLKATGLVLLLFPRINNSAIFIKRSMIKNDVQLLFEEQLNNWLLAADNYKALALVKTKNMEVNGLLYRVQFNPARIVSSAAKVDAQSIKERRCFLCSDNRPAEQKGIVFDDRYLLLINPYPIFPRHLTIPALEHTPQLISDRFGDMLNLAKVLDDYVLFYNGPKCGASAPDHFHFQAGNKGFLPIQTDGKSRGEIRIESNDKQEVFNRFREVYQSMELNPNDDEPMMNLLVWYEEGMWTVCVFPRKKHRPACYSAEGEDNVLISPASVDMGGVFITPLEKDFHKITAEDITTILEEL